MITIEIYVYGQLIESVAIADIFYFSDLPLEEKVTQSEKYIDETVRLLKIKHLRKLINYPYEIYIQIPSKIIPYEEPENPD